MQVLSRVEGNGVHLHIQSHRHAVQRPAIEGCPLRAAHSPVLSVVELQRPDALLGGEAREAYEKHALAGHTKGPTIFGAHFQLPVLSVSSEAT